MSTTLQHTYGIKPFNGHYESSYTYHNWVDDMMVYAKYHHDSSSHFEGIKQNEPIPASITITILLLFAGVAFLYSFHAKRFILLMKTFFNWKVAKQVIRYEKVYDHTVNLVLFAIFLISTPLLYTIAYQYYDFLPYNILYTTFFLSISILVYTLFKLVVYKISSWLFSLHDTMEEYIFQVSFFNKIFGLVNLFLLVILLYSPINEQDVIYISLGVLFVFMAIQLVRGVLIGKQGSIKLRLIILYLCTLEILPWIILGKWIKNFL